MAGEPNKQPEGGNGQPQDDANKQNTNGEPQKPNSGDDKGKKSNIDPSQFISKADYEKALAERDGTISALTKKLNGIEGGLKSIFGDGDKKATPEEMIQNLQNEIDTLKKKDKETSIKGFVGDYLDLYKDEDGNPLTPEAKNYIKKRFNAYDKDAEDIKQLLDGEIEDLSGLMQTTGRVDKSKAESRPDGKGGSQKRKLTANEILESMKS